jgi:hypothetical protein
MSWLAAGAPALAGASAIWEEASAPAALGVTARSRGRPAPRVAGPPLPWMAAWAQGPGCGHAWPSFVATGLGARLRVFVPRAVLPRLGAHQFVPVLRHKKNKQAPKQQASKEAKALAAMSSSKGKKKVRVCVGA